MANKYPVEHLIDNNRKIVDSLGGASSGEGVYIDGSATNISIDISKSDFIVLDLGNSSTPNATANITFINIKENDRFSLLLLESKKPRTLVFNSCRFPDYFVLEDSEFELIEDRKGLMYITFKVIDTSVGLLCIGTPSPWIESDYLTPSDDEGTPLDPPSTYRIEEGCIECGDCVEVCDYYAISEGSPYVIIEGVCTGCADCVGVCPVQVIVPND